MARRLVWLIALLAVTATGCGADGADYPAQGSAATITAQTASATTATSVAPAAAAAGKLRLVPVARFDTPLYATGAPGDAKRLFVVQQGGRIMVVRSGKKLATPFLDISSQVTAGGEQGLLSVAFAPDYQTSKRFYVYFTDKASKQRIVEFKRKSADRADPLSARVVMVMADPEGNHNGGLLMFGPDRLLYVGTGDGGGADDQHGARGNAQSLASPLGKLLRIDPRAGGGKAYTIPDANPFAARAGARAEIYAYGLRNPWRYSFDRLTGDLIIGDVGQGDIEEVDFAPKGQARGANFGWRPLEGTKVHSPGESAPGAVAPVIQRTHASGWCSITGGYVVRDKALTSLYGRYVYGDFCEGKLNSAKLSAGRATARRVLALKKIDQLSSFGQDTRGRIYVVSLSGPVYRLAQ